MGNPALAPEERFTYRQYRTWPEDERWELIDGHAYSMSPAPMRRHQELLARIFVALRTHLKGKTCQAYAAPFDVLLPKAGEEENEVDTIVQPDLVVYCDPGRLTPRGGFGAPDLVVEILSPRTTSRDFGTKLRLFARHGVREYWIVDGAAKAVHVWRAQAAGAGLAEARPRSMGPDTAVPGFGEEEVFEDEERLESSVLAGFALELGELFAGI